MKRTSRWFGFLCMLFVTSLWGHPDPAVPPFKSYISAVGIVESSSDNISIGTAMNRVIKEVFVTVGQKVKKGEPLFEMENNDLKAQLVVAEINANIASAKLDRLEAMPQVEDKQISEAQLKKAESSLALAKHQYEMTQGLGAGGALSLEEVNRRLSAFKQAEADFFQAQASFSKLEQGTWKPDLQIASLEVTQAKANLDQIKAEIDRTIIRSPIDGQILQVKIHEGELPHMDGEKMSLIKVGNTDEKNLLVSINQFDASDFRPKARAVAAVRGGSNEFYDLEFLRFDPYLVNKQNFTHDISERVDTRVLQVTYRIKGDHLSLFIGQQMDAFIETEAKQTVTSGK